MSKPKVCEHPTHEGSRVVSHINDLFEERTEWRRLTDQGRERVRVERRVCRTCMNTDLKLPASEQGALL